jgi:hypothetical protein
MAAALNAQSGLDLPLQQGIHFVRNARYNIKAAQVVRQHVSTLNSMLR